MKHARLLFSLALPLVVTAQAPDTFDQRVQVAREVETQPVPRQYIESILIPAMSSRMSEPTRSCLNRSGASKEKFILVANIGRDGLPTDVDVKPPTNTAVCFSASFRELRLAPPPDSQRGCLPIFIELTLTE